jgi:MFS family permease
MHNAFSLQDFNIVTIGGNMFENAIVLGMAIMTANGVSGFLMKLVSTTAAFQICALGGALFGLILTFTRNDRTLGTVTLFL